MKKVISLALLSLLVIFGGCKGRTDAGIRYDMEKWLVTADELRQKMLEKDRPLSAAEYDSLFEAYDKVVKAVKPPADSAQIAKASEDKKQAWAISALAQTREGILYLERRDFEKAFASFKAVYDNPIATPIQRNAVKTYLAATKEKAGDYRAAARLYNELAMEYLPLVVPQNPNMDALGAMIKSAEMYGKAGDMAAFNSTLENARAYYADLEKKYPGTSIANMALGKRIATYLHQEKYVDAIAALESTRIDSTGQLPPEILFMKGEILMNNLRDYAAAERTYGEFLKAYPNHARASSARMALGLSLYEQGKYSAARNAIKDIEAKRGSDQLSVEADYLSALCFEKEGEWDRALAKLNYIQATYPGSEKGFEAALFIANYYKKRNDYNLSQRAFKQAEDYIKKYTDPATSNPVLAAKALGFLVRCYMEMPNFEAAAATLKTLYEKFPKSTEGKLAPLKLADLYENILHDNAQAANWLRIFAEKNPDADNLKEINDHIAALLKQ